jgi:alpha-beta hydrolase superfamily lysophospholipase
VQRWLVVFVLVGVVIGRARSAAAGPARHGFTPAEDHWPAHGGDTADAAILIGGINETWRSLGDWVPVHAAAGRQVLGYTYDQRHDDLETCARQLAEALTSLAGQGVRRLHITAYSMGGWVAKAALDRMTADRSIDLFEAIELTALATPWGGFGRANIVWRLRHVPTAGIARAFSRAIGKPMAFEVGSRTPFVRARRAPLSPRVRFHVFEGGADETATPRTREERENYEAVVALAATRTLIRGARHADMCRVP